MANSVTRLYGIANCDTVKKARNWLEKNQVDYEFVDFRRDGINATQVKRWLKKAGIDRLLNKRSTTWKNLDGKDREGLNQSAAVSLMVEHPTLIKRPVLETGNEICQVGFKEAEYQQLF